MDKFSVFAVPSRVGLALVIVAGVAACDGGSKVTTGPPIVVVSPPPPPALIEDSFGARFGTIFRTSANSEPIDPVQSDISIPNDPTGVPLPLRP